MTPKFNSFYSRLILFVLFFFPCVIFGQTDFSFTIGGNLSNITPKESHLLQGDEVYLIPNKGYRELGSVLGLKIQREINSQFNIDYQLRLFNHVMEVACVPTGQLHGCFDNGKGMGFWHIIELDKADVFGTIHSISFNFRLNEKFYAGIGGYYQMTNYDEEKDIYSRIFRLVDYFSPYWASRQTGCLGTVSYIHKFWTLETRFLKGIGNTFGYSKQPDFFKSTDGIELSLSYKFLTKQKKKNKSKSK